VAHTVKKGETALENQGVVAEMAAQFESHPHWQLVQRIVGSPQFVRSVRLKNFLLYVTRCALLDHADHVSEQQIGIHVFGKAPDYNASEDNIVRSQARFLRIKLGEYFESEAGREEPVVLTIPKGTYLPRFSARGEAPAMAADTVRSATLVESPQAGRPRWLRIPAAIAILLLLAGAVWIWDQARGGRVQEAGLWARMFDSHQPTMIVASDYIFSMVQEAAGRTLSLDEYLSDDYFKRVTEMNAASGLERLFPNIAQRHYTGFENVTSVARLMALKQAQSTQSAVRFARDLTMREIGSGNLILIGSNQSDPWVSLFEPKLNFHFDYQPSIHNIFVTNRAPQTGEEAEYRPSPLDPQTRVIYGGIAFLPNLNRGSNVLILQGTSMGGSEIALEILQNPALFRDLIRVVKAGRTSSQLPYFEALIRTRTRNGVAGEFTIIGTRVLGE
jgi:hypothetical protein